MASRTPTRAGSPRATGRGITVSVAGIGSLVVLTTSGPEVRRAGTAGHGTVEVHQARLGMPRPGGREHAVSVAWSRTPNPWDDEILRRST